MRKYFTAGLALLLPVVFTIMVVRFLVNFLTKPFLEPVKKWMVHLHIFDYPPLLFSEAVWIAIISKALILVLLFAFMILIGFLGELFLINYLFRLGNHLFHQLPFINKIYKPCHDLVRSLFSSSKSFSQVVLVPYPNSQYLSLGFMTGASIKVKTSQPNLEQDLVSVFVPGTPNPSVGFLLMFKKEQLTFINMRVEDAMKCIVSCGTVMPNFTLNQPYAAHET